MNHDETIEYYQKRAGEYDKVYSRDNPGRQEELADLYALSRDTLEGRNVLDLGCGTGYWTKIISEQARTIIGVDINSTTLAEAEKKKYRCPVQFIRADAFDLPFANNNFDGLLICYILSHIKRQDMDILARSVKRVIQPGSPAFLCDNNLICELEPDLIWDKEHINSYKKRRLENGREYEILKNYFEKEELIEIIRHWGKVEKLTYNRYYWSVLLTLQ